MSCRLYLVSPPDLGADDLDAFAAALDGALAAGDVACVLLLSVGMTDAALAAAIERLRPRVQARDVAFLLAERVETAAATGCDGVHVAGPGAYADARQRLGPNAIVGVGCDDSRHAAMVAGEAGADYVAFGRPDPESAPADPELLTWWQTIMIVPCVAFGAAEPEDCRALALAGADFVAVGAGVWDHPDGPGAAVAACNAALAEAAGYRPAER